MAARRVVVVGAGGISKAWFGPLASEQAEIVGVVDLNVDSAQKRIDEHKLACKPSTNLRATLRKTRPDFVVDLTVPEAHCGVTCTALRAGCHVIGEKPLAAGMAQARRMVKVADQTGKLYMVSQSRRWDHRHDRVRLATSAGMLGRLTTVNCDFYIGAHFGGFRDEMPSPLILDMAIHHFDLVRFMTGLDPVSVYAQEFNPHGSWYRGDVAATCIFEMTGGVYFTYRGSWCAEGFATSWNGDWRIIGDRGSLIYAADTEPRTEVVAGDTGFIRPYQQVDPPPSPLQYKTMHGALREMLEFLDTGKLPQTECHDNIKSLAMVFAAIESSRKGRRVPVRA